MHLVALPLALLLQSTSVGDPAPTEIDECDARYFGIAGAQDSAKALRCYEERKRWVMVALMRLNGEGTAADAKAAETALRQVGQGTDEAAEAQALSNIIRRRINDPGDARMKVDFCNDVAQSQRALDRCAAIENGIQGQAVQNGISSARARLTPVQQPKLDALAAALGRLARLDGDRLFQQYVEGAVKESAAQKQQAVVRRNFVEVMRLWLDGRDAATAPAATKLPDLERALESAYRTNLGAYVEAYGPRKGMPADVAAAHKRYAGDYRRKVGAAKQAWAAYRDAWLSLLGTLHPPAKIATIKQNARTYLTATRLDEVRTDPFDRN